MSRQPNSACCQSVVGSRSVCVCKIPCMYCTTFSFVSVPARVGLMQLGVCADMSIARRTVLVSSFVGSYSAAAVDV